MNKTFKEQIMELLLLTPARTETFPYIKSNSEYLPSILDQHSCQQYWLKSCRKFKNDSRIFKSFQAKASWVFGLNQWEKIQKNVVVFHTLFLKMVKIAVQPIPSFCHLNCQFNNRVDLTSRLNSYLVRKSSYLVHSRKI